jgi:hypothetical protein
VKLDHRFVEKEVYDLTVHRTIDKNTEASNFVAELAAKKNETLDLKARMMILALGPAGQASKFRLEIERFTANGRHLITPGNAIDITRAGGRNSFEAVNASKLPGNETQDLLIDLFPALTSGKSTLDDQYPARTKRKVNEAWDLDAQKIADYFFECGTTMTTKTISGGACVKEVRTAGDAKYLVVQTAFKADLEKVARVPSNSTFLSGNAAIAALYVIPQDPADRSFEKTETVRVIMNRQHATKPAGATDTIIQQCTFKLVPVKQR